MASSPASSAGSGRADGVARLTERVSEVWRVDQSGTYLDGQRLSDVTIENLTMSESPHIAVRIGVDNDARYAGGVNLFGSGFGNHAQDIVMRMRF